MWSVISELMFWLMLLCIIAIPVLLIIFVVRWATKKRKLWFGLSAWFCFIGIFIFAILFGIANYAGMTPEERLEQEKAQEIEAQEKAEEKAAKEQEKEEKKEQEKKEQEEKENKKEPVKQEEKEEEDKEPNKEEPKKEQADKEPPKESIPEKVEPENNSSTTQKVDDMIAQFMDLGFTESEAKEIKDIFHEVGIKKISNISPTLGSGLDGEQHYVCNLYNYNPNTDCIKVSFNIVKREVHYVTICFSPYGQLGSSPDNNRYSNLILHDGIKENSHSDSITLYYKKLVNYEVDNSSNGYVAVYDYETHSISKY